MNNAVKIAGVIFGALILIGGIEAGAGLYMFKQIEASYKSKSFKINSINSNGVQMEVTLIIKNPSPFGIVLNSYDLDAYINGAKIANFKSNKPKELLAKKYSYLTLPITVNWKNSFPSGTGKNLFNYFVMQEYDKIVLTVSGRLSGSTLKIPVNKEIELKYTLKEIQELLN